MATVNQPDTLAERLVLQGKQPVSDVEVVNRQRQAVSKQTPGNASYWAEKRRKQRKGGKAA